MSRLAKGGLIDRSAPLDFTFDGTRYQGFRGDTLASALVANEVKLLGRSFKYHRPRGLLSAGSEEPNALVTLRGGSYSEPNSRATGVELYDGLEARSQNRWPTLRFDLMAINQVLAPILAAGFYYKTFMWPTAFWERVYEPVIRRAAGLGRLSMLPDPDIYDRSHAFCDLLVIGAGPAGLHAARIAGRAGLRVFVVDDDSRAGGRLLAERHEIDGAAGHEWASAAAAELKAMPNVTVLRRTMVFGVYDDREYGAIERISDHLSERAPGQPRQRYWKIVARHAILATGSIERPHVFGGNDRPGVMLASAVSTYVNRYAAAPGRRAVVFTSSDTGWRTALDLQAAGVEVAAVVETRAAAPDIADTVRQSGTEILVDARIKEAIGSPVRAVDVIASGRNLRIAADLVAMAGGWNPTIGIASNLGGRPRWSENHQCFLIENPPPGLVAVGAASGHFGLGDALRNAAEACAEILEAIGRKAPPAERLTTSDDPATALPLWYVPERKGKAFVDFQNDVTADDVELAVREGFTSVEHLKRYTTLGMATDQGKTSNLNGHSLLAAATGRTIAETGTIMSRPPYQPVAIAALAGLHRGQHFRPTRLTASHAWASAQGAVFTEAGLWKRAQWFPRAGDRNWRQTVDREVSRTRGGAGICDVSTLGKIDVHGPDAGTLLDRLYVNMFSTLPVGRARYGLMLREDGFVFDDGTASRLATDHYFVTTTTANAARVMQHIDFARQVLWPELDVQATSVTEQWSTYSVAGPKSRAIVQELLPQVDLSNDAFPFMAVTEFRWHEVTARLFRLSFSGELAYEISVPACRGDVLLRKLLEIGQPMGLVAYGTEALSVMRIEKGHIAGPELNGQTTAGDLGMGRMMSKKKDFIGRVLAGRPGLIDPARPTLVGLKPIDRTQEIGAGAHLVRLGARSDAASDEGHVTSAAWSPTLGHNIALGLLAYGPERHGEHVVAHDALRDRAVVAEVTGPVFLDLEGARVRG